MLGVAEKITQYGKSTIVNQVANSNIVARVAKSKASEFTTGI